MNFSGFIEFKSRAEIYVVGEALSNLNDIDSHINRVHKVPKQSKGDETRGASTHRHLTASLGGKCDMIHV